MRGFSVVLGVVAAVLFVPPQLWANTFYLKNGEQIEYQRYWHKDGRINVLINRDTEVDFPLDEVDLKRTARAAAAEKKKAAVAEKKKAKRKNTIKRPAANPLPAAKPAPVAKPAPAQSQAASAPLQAELAAVYDKFHRATLAGDLDGQMKYVAAKNQAEMKEMLAKAPGKAKALVAGLMQAMTAKSYAVTGSASSPDGRSATLNLRGKVDFMGKDADCDGTIDFVKEGSEWKIDKVAWNAKG